MSEIATVTVAGPHPPLPRPPLLLVDQLAVSFPAGKRWVQVVRGASLAVRRREIVGLVGESGSGKSLTALAVLRLVPPPGRVAGRVLLDGEDLLALPERELRRVRGARIGMVFQEPMAALDPVYTIGFQIAEAVAAHRTLPRRAALAEAARLLDRVRLAGARRLLGDYPHQLSGGQRQRAMLAMALAAGPDLLLADEPTSALDVTLQAQILDLLGELRAELGLAVLLISHDLAVVAASCDRVVVFYAGQVVEEAPAAALFAAPAHPYTRGLLAALPRLGRPVGRGRLPVLAGQPPEPASRPSGCAFHPRCPEAMAVCALREPELGPPASPTAGAGSGAETAMASEQRAVRCWLHVEPGKRPGASEQIAPSTPDSARSTPGNAGATRSEPGAARSTAGAQGAA
ncbi:MAG TPA: ABC transporter ATP-binding protein [Thermoanaerobaculia bacterium]|nr:ABC transporter ATP-binding protein [Thermoanaerobaculia bacterium]